MLKWEIVSGEIDVKNLELRQRTLSKENDLATVRRRQ